jgi:hypothetical protein
MIMAMRSLSSLPLARPALPLLLAALLLFNGCRPEEAGEEPGSDSTEASSALIYDLSFREPTFENGRQLDSVIAVDLDDDGRVEYMVSSLGTAGFRPADARADLLEIYRFDTVSRSWQIAVQDSVEWATDFSLDDVTGDNTPELVVRTYSGGNDVVASSGLRVYSKSDHGIKPIFRASNGAPEFRSVERLAGRAIVVFDEIWPMFSSHADALIYPSQLYGYRDGQYRDVGADYGDFFMKKMPEIMRGYRQLREELRKQESYGNAVDTAGNPTSGTHASADDDDELGMDRETQLFNQAALAIVTMRNGSARRSLLAFWDSEREFLKRHLPEPYYDELTTIYSGGVPQ